jgi:hypothetical protein
MKTEYCLMADKNIREIYLQTEVYLSGSQNLSELHNPSIFIVTDHFPHFKYFCVLNELHFLFISL